MLQCKHVIRKPFVPISLLSNPKFAYRVRVEAVGAAFLLYIIIYVPLKF